jgi:hypothetical protein
MNIVNTGTYVQGAKRVVLFWQKGKFSVDDAKKVLENRGLCYPNREDFEFVARLFRSNFPDQIFVRLNPENTWIDCSDNAVDPIRTSNGFGNCFDEEFVIVGLLP